MTIRRLNSTDLQSLKDLNVVFSEAFADPETHLSKKPSDPYLLKLLSKPHVIVLAAFDGATVVGGLVAYVMEKYEQERSEIYIYDLAVAETHRRRGIARDMILHLKSIGKEIGAWVILVQADKPDTPAIRLYESLGTKEEPLHFDILIEQNN
ncbi:AAC(3)-I family aminoglycoside 3-N-acetyltransferase [Bdellovibrio bacteriovorus]|uniref:AAC(3)-I family aminoglycoside 3-N-acetyltransferase n=1 Tax=Bdellovibrio bacteriovorus TaxID=959 RepID=A0A162FYF4_BDEBC|nr:AAC(3)-I family aminoglycoside N-acetyltransferase [Bdellovibrio bacteriovorus]KYG62778.1 AAC(3)-I family aminoglycoside 3-N-acetyltransferase [Bdellovibrio bacteriovorus]